MDSRLVTESASRPPQPLAPGGTIGILGGGQLGRMTALAAARLGYRCHIYCPEADCPASQVTPLATAAAYDDREALARFAHSVDLITLEFENIPLDAARFLAGLRPLRPGAGILETCQSRLREKAFCRSLGIATAPHAEVTGPEDLRRAVAAIGRPAILKTAELGYDGKGQARIETETDLDQAWRAVCGERPVQSVLEGFVAFDLELSVIVARSPTGDCAAFPAVENRHRNQILDRTLVPGRVPPDAARRAEAIARHMAEALDLVGLLAIEMFLASDGEILVNELAPRPHNSGHWTLDACVTSQFEQLIRAVGGHRRARGSRDGEPAGQ